MTHVCKLSCFPPITSDAKASLWLRVHDELTKFKFQSIQQTKFCCDGLCCAKEKDCVKPQMFLTALQILIQQVENEAQPPFKFRELIQS